MGSITVGKSIASFALADIILFFGCCKLKRSEFAAFVWAVAKGLVLGKSACAVIVIFANLQLYPKSQIFYCFGHLSTAQGSVILAFSASVDGGLR